MRLRPPVAFAAATSAIGAVAGLAIAHTWHFRATSARPSSPSITIAFPAPGRRYRATVWSAGCRRGPAICGTRAPKPPTAQSASPLSLAGKVAGLLYPGGSPLRVPVRLSNPNAKKISVTSLKVSVQSTSLPDGCSASGFRLTQSSISPDRTVQVPAYRSVTLPTQGVTAPTIAMLNTPYNQDPCQSASLRLAYRGTAH
jgi:hypothetical protein